MPHPKQLRDGPTEGAEFPTTDRSVDPTAEDRYLAPIQLGAVQRLTPEGYLLCIGVPIARTGVLLYLANEMPKLKAGPDGIIRVLRDETGLFVPDAMRSLEGKPITEGHPSQWITPENWKRYAVGTMQNVRRGEGVQEGLLLADLLITDAGAISAVRSGLREVSLGYDARYQQDEPGAARQTITKGNHIALVKSGRCGTSCSIGDEDMTKKRSWADRIRTAFRAQDEAALNEELENAPAEKTGDEDGDEPQRVVIEVKQVPAEPAAAIEPAKATDEDEGSEPLKALADAVAALADRMTALEAAMKPAEPAKAAVEDEPAKKEEEAAKAADTDGEDKGEGTKDSADLRDEFTATLSGAEVLVPGIALPAFDAAAPAAKTRAALHALRITALSAVHATTDGKTMIATFDAAPNIPAMKGDALRVLFNATVASRKAINNAKATERQTRDAAPQVGVIHDPAELNRRAAKRYGRAA